MPKEMKKAYGNIVAALGRKDGRLIESLKGTLDRTVFVAREDLNATRLHEKVLTRDRVSAAVPSPLAARRVAGSRDPPRSPSWTPMLAYRKNAGSARAPASRSRSPRGADARRGGPVQGLESGYRRRPGPRRADRLFEPDERDPVSGAQDLITGPRPARPPAELLRDSSRVPRGGPPEEDRAPPGPSPRPRSPHSGHDRSAQQAGGKAEGGTTKKD